MKRIAIAVTVALLGACMVASAGSCGSCGEKEKKGDQSSTPTNTAEQAQSGSAAN